MARFHNRAGRERVVVPQLTPIDVSTPTLAVELFDYSLRRSFIGGGTHEYLPSPFTLPLGTWYSAGVLHAEIQTFPAGGATPTLEFVFDDSSDGQEWAEIARQTLANPPDGTHRLTLPTPFGAFLRVRLLVSGSGGIVVVGCRVVLTLERRRRLELDGWTPPPIWDEPSSRVDGAETQQEGLDETPGSCTCAEGANLDPHERAAL